MFFCFGVGSGCGAFGFCGEEVWGSAYAVVGGGVLQDLWGHSFGQVGEVGVAGVGEGFGGVEGDVFLRVGALEVPAVDVQVAAAEDLCGGLDGVLAEGFGEEDGLSFLLALLGGWSRVGPGVEPPSIGFIEARSWPVWASRIMAVAGVFFERSL